MLSQSRSATLPVLALLAAATFWGTLWYPLRWLEDQGLAGLWATCGMFGAVLLVGLPLWVLYRDATARHPFLLAAIGLSAGACNVAFVLAVLEGSVVRVLLLFYLSPLWALIFGRWLLDERLTGLAIATVALAVAGALVVLWQPGQFPWPEHRADWLAIGSGLFFALSNVLTRKGRDLPVPLKTVSTWAGVVLLASIGLLTYDYDLPQVTTGTWVIVVALGWFGVGLMTILVMYGVTHLPVYRSAVILLFEVLVGAVSAWWLAGEILGWQEWVGGIVILYAGWLAARSKEREAGD